MEDNEPCDNGICSLLLRDRMVFQELEQG